MILLLDVIATVSMHVPNQCYLDANSNCFLEKSFVSEKKRSIERSIESKFYSPNIYIYIYIYQKRSIFVLTHLLDTECVEYRISGKKKKRKERRKKSSTTKEEIRLLDSSRG